MIFCSEAAGNSKYLLLLISAAPKNAKKTNKRWSENYLDSYNQNTKTRLLGKMCFSKPHELKSLDKHSTWYDGEACTKILIITDTKHYRENTKAVTF